MRNVLIIGDYVADSFHPFKGMDSELAAILGPDYSCTFESDYGRLDYSDLSGYDLLLSYAEGPWCENCNTGFVAALLTYVVNGGIFMPIHFGGCFGKDMRKGPMERDAKWHELISLTGGRFNMFHPVYSAIDIVPDSPGHPACSGIAPFVVEEEPYMFEMGSFGDIKHLFSAHYGNLHLPVFWYADFGSGIAATLTLGHSVSVMKVPEVRQMIRQFADWACAGHQLG